MTKSDWFSHHSPVDSPLASNDLNESASWEARNLGLAIEYSPT
jgi:hypothetical protein